MKRFTRPFLWGAAVALFVLSLAAGCAPAGPGTVAPSPAPTVQTESGIYLPTSSYSDGELQSVADVVAKVKPSVVAISTEITTRDLFNRPWTQQAAGSGWIIREDGYIVTNNHVVEDASTVLVTLDDGRSLEAVAVFTDPLTDLAVIKIAASDLPAVDIGNSSELRVGDPVVAIGNSLGMGISATAGIASAVGVSLASSEGQTLLELVQTDAAINPGNSGGPLVNAAGQVICINSIKIAQIGVEGMGYAISINQALPVIQELIANGRIARAWLGVGSATVTPSVSARYGLAVDSGVYITEVVAGSPAENAGLQPGDIIVALGGSEITNTNDFTRAITSRAVGDEVEVVFYRGEAKESSIATLGASPE